MTHSIIIDTREPWPHPYAPYFSDNITVERGTLETGDIALAALPDAAVVERKTVTDLLGCIGKGRDRFERELKRSRYCGRFIVIIEGTFADVIQQSRGIHPSSLVGSLAAWQYRYCSFCFAGNTEMAAKMAERFLLTQVRDIDRQAKVLSA